MLRSVLWNSGGGGVRDGGGKCLVEYFVVEGISSTKAFTALALAGSLQCC